MYIDLCIVNTLYEYLWNLFHIMYIYINLSSSNTLLQIFMKTCTICLYICIVKIILWMCHYKTLENLKTVKILVQLS